MSKHPDMKSLARNLTADDVPRMLSVLKFARNRPLRQAEDICDALQPFRELYNAPRYDPDRSPPKLTFVNNELGEVRKKKSAPIAAVYLHWLFETWPEGFAAFLNYVIAKRDKADQIELETVFSALPGWRDFSTPHLEFSLRTLDSYEAKFSHLLANAEDDYEATGIDGHYRDFASTKASGIWLLTGGPGQGKTAAMAQIAAHLKSQSPVVFFFFSGSIHDAEESRISVAYRHILGCLRAYYGEVIDQLTTKADAPHEAFADVLEALSHSGRVSSERPLHIVIDGLDEIHPVDRSGAPVSNPLRLPSRLPEGVYIALSTRLTSTVEGEFGGIDAVPRFDRRLSLDSAESKILLNQAVEKYAFRVAADNPDIQPFHMAGQPGAQHASNLAFVHWLCELCGWNFLIARCLLHEREYWRRGGTGEAASPSLSQFYKEFFLRMIDRQEFGVEAEAAYCFGLDSYLSKHNFNVLTCGLPSAERQDRRPSLALSEWASQGLIIERLRAETPDDVRWFAAYHRTFREFLNFSFKQHDRVDFLLPFLQRMTSSGQVSLMVHHYRELNVAAISKEWVELTIKFCMWTENLVILRALLMNLEFVRFAFMLPDGINSVLRNGGHIVPKFVPSEQVEALYRDFAQQLIEWVNTGQLADHNDVLISIDEMAELMAAPIFHHTFNSVHLAEYFLEIAADG